MTETGRWPNWKSSQWMFPAYQDNHTLFHGLKREMNVINRSTFRSGEIQSDEKGLYINAHEDGILFHEDIYDWPGEQKSPTRPRKFFRSESGSGCLAAASKFFQKLTTCGLERIKKYCSHPVGWRMKPSLLTFGFVSAQSQVFFNMLLRQSLAKSQNSHLRMATLFFKPL